MEQVDKSDFGYEPDDPSVGIFGETFWHDTCTASTDITELADNVEVNEKILYTEGSGVNRFAIIEQTVKCKLCKKYAVSTWRVWTPEEET